LGSVLSDAPAERGPDLLLELTAPPDWLRQGERLSVELPRRLTCARCEGGGCDICERRGAFTLREADEEADVVQLTLSQDVGEARLQIRVPDRGAPGAEGEAPGQLVVSLSAGEAPSPGLSRRASTAEPPKLPLPWVALGALLALIYAIVTVLTRG
jgi:hypothetical protein